METNANSILGQMNQEIPSERVNRLIDSLLHAEFIQTNQLGSLSLEELGEKLFAAKERNILSPEGHAASDEAIEKCIHDYCLLLQELEDQKITDFTVQTLPDLRQRETKTQFLKAIEGLESTPAPEAVSSTDIELTLPEPPTGETPIQDPFAQETLAAGHDPLMNWEKPGNAEDDISPISTWMQEGVTQASDFPLDAATPTEEPSAPEFRLEPPQALDNTGLQTNPSIKLHPVSSEEEKKLINPEEHENTLSSWGVPPPLPTTIPTPLAVVEEVLPSSDPAPAKLHLSPRSDAFWKTGAELESHEFSKIPEDHRKKIAAVSFCWAVESELTERLWNSLAPNWGDRAIAIVTTLDTAHRKFDLHPALRSELEKRATLHSHFLHEGKLPYSGIINSLRYVLATEDLEKFRPSILDWGVVLFWFGKEEDRHGIKFSNLLGIEEMPTNEMTELVFLLFHLNKLRMRALASTNHLEAIEVGKIKQTAHRILELLQLVQMKSDWKSEQVA